MTHLSPEAKNKEIRVLTRHPFFPHRLRAFTLCLIFGAFLGTPWPTLSAEVEIADALYSGGPILTLENDGEQVEAVAKNTGKQ